MSSPNLFFPTPVWVSQLENYNEVNDKILTYIKNIQNEDSKGIIKSNIKGWHSKDFDLKNKNVVEFINNISSQINQVINNMNWDISNQAVKISSMWAIINIGGASNARHHHGNSTISAAYYVKAPKNCGKFTIENPNSINKHSYPPSNKKTKFNSKLEKLDIEEGDLFIFPAHLPHGVEENKSDDDRIVISFNIIINNFKN